MGLFSQRAIQKRIAPVTAEVGPWLGRVRAELPFLTETQALYLAGLQAVLDAGPAVADSRTSILGEGKQSVTARMMSQRDSILRFEGFGASARLTLGTPGNVLDWRTDWSLKYAIGAAAGEITVPEYRTWDGEIANAGRLDRVRAALAGALAHGPRLLVAEGRPDPAAHLVTVRRDSDSSPTAGDHCDSAAATVPPPVRLACPPAALLDAAAARGHVLDRDPATGDPLIHLAPGGRPDLGTVRVLAVNADLNADLNGATDLVFAAGGALTPIDRQRVRRRSLRLLNNLAVDLGRDHPASAALHEAVARVAAASADTGTWTEAWTDQVPGPQWTPAPGGVLPVAVLATSKGPGALLDRMVEGASAVALRRRTFTRGLTRKGREDGRVVVARNAAILAGADGAYLPYVRYVAAPDTGEATVAVARDDLPMFWEVFHDDRTADDRTATDRMTADGTASLLFATGLGFTGGTVAYGAELLAYLDASCAAIARRDPGATFRTIGLRVPEQS